MEVPTPATSATGEVSYLVRTILTWFMSDSGFKEYSMERKLDELNKLIKKALDDRQYGVATELTNQLYLLSVGTPT